MLFAFILGGQFLFPERANMEEGEFLQLQKKKRQRDLVHKAFNMVHLVLRRSHLLTVMQGSPISGSGRGFVIQSAPFAIHSPFFLILARGFKNGAGRLRQK